MKKIKIAYIGGGSKMWAQIFMKDLALTKELYGDISLYDIDVDAAKRNAVIGKKISSMEGNSKFNYVVAVNIEECLKDADFVLLSILPGTFDEMMVDVHEPEKYHIYQTVGDTVGPGGVIRSMRTVPIYEYFAKKIKECSPKAWVINFTNPMSICVKTLYDVFPEIKAFGCCHEVFHAQEFMAMVVEEHLGLDIRPNRKEMEIDVEGINHFTWITSCKYKNLEVLPWIEEFTKKHFEEGIYEGKDPKAFLYNTFAYGNKVKMDSYKRYGVLAAAGDRHLVEFMNNNWYLKDLDYMKEEWAVSQTTVAYRINDMKEKIKKLNDMKLGISKIIVEKSNEEAIDIMLALLGFKDLVTNVNYPNIGQVIDLPLADIVESNCVFSFDEVKPINAKEVPLAVRDLILRNDNNINITYEGIKKRDLNIIFQAFLNQPLCSSLSIDEAKELFKSMIKKTRKYLDEYYEDIDNYLNGV